MKHNLSANEQINADMIRAEIAKGVADGVIHNTATMKAGIAAAGVTASAALISYFMKLHNLVKDKGMER